MLELRPDREIKRLEGQEFVQDWIHVVFLQPGSFQLFEVEEGDFIGHAFRVVRDPLESCLDRLKGGGGAHRVLGEFVGDRHNVCIVCLKLLGLLAGPKIIPWELHESLEAHDHGARLRG